MCGTAGEATFRGEWSQEFRDKTVRLILDNDDAGRRGMARIAGKLHGVAKAVSTVVWPEGFREHGDAEDWLSGGHTLEELVFETWDSAVPNQATGQV